MNEAVVDDDIRVLLIDDDEEAAEMYRSRLAADGYAVSVAHDGQQGLDMVSSESPDLIYLDLRLPRKDGFSVLEQLRKDPRTATVPVIILSNFGERELRARGIALGALEFLVKSNTTPAELVDATDRWRGAATKPSSAG
jgi:DNA-binding response OmpR family regulator